MIYDLNENFEYRRQEIRKIIKNDEKLNENINKRARHTHTTKIVRMDLTRIAETLSASHLRSYKDDDLWIDRLHHRYSVVIYLIFAILVTSKAYIGDPIGNLFPFSIFFFQIFFVHY
jgi:hypothetical protein